MNLLLIKERFEDLSQPTPPDGWMKPHLVIADPPDNSGKKYDGVADKIPIADYKRLLRIWIKMCCGLTDGPVFFIPAASWMNEVEGIIRDEKIKRIQLIIWKYNFGQYHGRRYGFCYRPIYWLNNGSLYSKEIRIRSARQACGDTRANPDGKIPSNVWEFPRVCGNYKEKRKWHTCQLPEALVERIIKGHSQIGDVVLDPFIGSGTTAYVGLRNRRHVIGIDASESYLFKIKQEVISGVDPEGDYNDVDVKLAYRK